MPRETKETQRAYTLKLAGTGDPEDRSWRDALWQTHLLVNRGAAIWGDFLLSFRAGIRFTAAEVEDPEERKVRRRICALCWLTVETATPSGNELPWFPVENPVAELGEVLRQQGADPDMVERWLADCQPTLTARIRDDARWVNRWAAWRQLTDGMAVPEEDRLDFVEKFLGGSAEFFGYEGDGAEDGDRSMAIMAGNWLSARLGAGSGSNYGDLAVIYAALAERAAEAAALGGVMDVKKWLEDDVRLNGKIEYGSATKIRGTKGRDTATILALKRLTGGDTSREAWQRLAEKAKTEVENASRKVGAKGARDYSDALHETASRLLSGVRYRYQGPGAKNGKDLTWQFAVILDHAARKVRMWHTWMKRQEAERRKVEETLRTVSIDPIARQWLEGYCEERSARTESLDGYRIRKRAIGGWEEVLREWTARKAQTAEERVRIARELQEGVVEKFGDIQLFEALAEDDARAVWADGARTLKDFVEMSWAEEKRRHYKVPAYRPPDPFLHPIYCDYGKSRWGVEYVDLEETRLVRRIWLETWDGKALAKNVYRWQSKRMSQELIGSTTGTAAPRITRFGRAVADSGDVFPEGLFEKEEWSARLQADREMLRGMGEKWKGERPELIPAQELRRIPWFVTFSAELIKAPKATERESRDKGRGRMAQVDFARRAGLRLLSVDLGLRVGASCTVWETLSGEQFRAECEAWGTGVPSTDQIGFTAKKDGRQKFYRRIGSDVLDGKPHPAPWARLERQFAIRLDGEKGARRLTLDEAAVIERELPGLAGTLRKGRAPEDLARVFEEARRALNWHGAKAKLAYYLRRGEDSRGTTEKQLAQWLRRSKHDEAARLLWLSHLGKHEEYLRKERIKKGELTPVVEFLEGEPSLRDMLANHFAEDWEREDLEWQRRLKVLRGIALPRKKAGKQKIWRMGGISLDRISNVTALYELNRAYKNRPRPGDPEANVPREAEGDRFGKRLIEIRDQLRENRVKQLASRIVEAALGLGKEPKAGAKRAPVRSEDSRYAPCQLVVIEKLDSYRPKETQTRRENRGLMNWAKTKIKKYLEDECELDGLRLWEVMPGYTSQFDFRTGKAGKRCRTVSGRDTRSVWWSNRMKSAEGKEKDFLQEVETQLKVDENGRWLIPQRGGPIFVPIGDGGPIDADLNASANIGLLAILDPDWSGRWQYVPTDSETGVPLKDRTEGARALERFPAKQQTKAKGKGARPVTNQFRLDPGEGVEQSHWMTYAELNGRVTEAVVRELSRRQTQPDSAPDPDTPF